MFALLAINFHSQIFSRAPLQTVEAVLIHDQILLAHVYGVHIQEIRPGFKPRGFSCNFTRDQPLLGSNRSISVDRVLAGPISLWFRFNLPFSYSPFLLKSALYQYRVMFSYSRCIYNSDRLRVASSIPLSLKPRNSGS